MFLIFIFIIYISEFILSKLFQDGVRIGYTHHQNMTFQRDDSE